LRKVFGPSQFGEQGTQKDEPVDIGGGGEQWHLGAQTGHPAEEVRLPAQLIKGGHFRVSGTEIAKEIAHRPAVLTMAFRAERRAERIDGAVKDRG
jgi:alpha-D-ribose 1-methylphosphonate 5-triphosphate synthase subunit PhnG